LRFRDRLPVLFAHDQKDLPVGQVTDVRQMPKRTVATWQWREGDEQATRVKNAYEQGMLAASIGFLSDDAVRNEFGGLDHKVATVEFSLVPSPANPDCLARLRAARAASSS
jgi:hypothetical protein